MLLRPFRKAYPPGAGGRRARGKRPMRLVVRILGFLLLAGALLAAAWQFQLWAQSGRFIPLALGQMWFKLDASSLNLTQAVIERYVWPPLWDPVILTVLRWPAWAVLGLPALILLVVPIGKGRRPVVEKEG
jgi:hypothetical protein